MLTAALTVIASFLPAANPVDGCEDFATCRKIVFTNKWMAVNEEQWELHLDPFSAVTWCGFQWKLFWHIYLQSDKKNVPAGGKWKQQLQHHRDTLIRIESTHEIRLCMMFVFFPVVGSAFLCKSSVTSHLVHYKCIHLIISSIWHYSSRIHKLSNLHTTSPLYMWPGRE